MKKLYQLIGFFGFGLSFGLVFAKYPFSMCLLGFLASLSVLTLVAD